MCVMTTMKTLYYISAKQKQNNNEDKNKTTMKTRTKQQCTTQLARDPLSYTNIKVRV